MTWTCPNGHSSSTGDYCDTCGAAIEATAPAAPPATAAAPPAAASADTCPNCGAGRVAGDEFCEVCGLEFATGKLPAAPPPPAPAASGPAPAADWSVTVAADRTFFEKNESDTPDALAFPADISPKEVALTSDQALIGRRSDPRGIFPDIDLSEDSAVSHRHATLRRQADGWDVVDEGSTNGTRVNGAADPLPAGEPARLHDGDWVNVGAWTRITLHHRQA